MTGIQILWPVGGCSLPADIPEAFRRERISVWLLRVRSWPEEVPPLLRSSSFRPLNRPDNLVKPMVILISNSIHERIPELVAAQSPIVLSLRHVLLPRL